MGGLYMNEKGVKRRREVWRGEVWRYGIGMHEVWRVKCRSVEW